MLSQSVRDLRFSYCCHIFLQLQITDTSTLLSFSYLPFGGGPRKCVRDMFASFETVVAVAMLVLRFNFQMALGAPPVMKSCSKLSKIFLTAMVCELYKTGMGETTFEKLAMTVSCLCTSNGESFPGWDTLLKVGCKLGECRIILCEPRDNPILLLLQVGVFVVADALFIGAQQVGRYLQDIRSH
ncbi:hypothetical protein REPUB_Repub09cG0054900 [Reevesia pubescens]